MFRFGLLSVVMLVGAIPSASAASGEWGGGYVGADIEYAQTNLSYRPDTWIWYDREFGDAKLGLLAGYTVDLGSWIIGVEADVSFLDSSSDTFGPISAVTVSTQSSIRARVGYDGGNVLYYVTGGAAFADAESTYISGAVGSDEHSHEGYVIGGGIEFAVTETINLRGEYLYRQFDRENYHFPGRTDLGEFDQSAVRASAVLHW